jgi:hypothetical protein
MVLRKLFILSIIFLLQSCGNADRVTVLSTLSNTDGKKLIVTINAGKFYGVKKKLGFLEIKITPQMAVWAEDTKGNYIDTLYVTKAFAKQKWMFVKYDPDKPLRTSCLPYWMNQRLKAGLAVPTKNNPLPDSITGATPRGSYLLNTKVNKDLKEAVILIELNKSFDVNDAYHGSEKGFTPGTVNGQPSVIYSARIDLTGTNSYQMKLLGRGGETGSDGKLYPDTNGLTTALEQAAGITVQVVE